MCGIVGYIGPKETTEVLVEGLRRLEYRGYDSAGIAVVDDNGNLELRRAAGKLRDLEKVLLKNPADGRFGLGHTRWATHGRPTEENAHPHRDCSGKLVGANCRARSASAGRCSYLVAYRAVSGSVHRLPH